MADKNYGLLISALVAMVAIVGLVVLLSGNSTGAVTVIRGSTATHFDRPLGGAGSGLAGYNEPCYYSDEGSMVCPGVAPSQRTFGAPSTFRQGGEPTVVYYADRPEYYS